MADKVMVHLGVSPGFKAELEAAAPEQAADLAAGRLDLTGVDLKMLDRFGVLTAEVPSEHALKPLQERDEIQWVEVDTTRKAL